MRSILALAMVKRLLSTAPFPISIHFIFLTMQHQFILSALLFGACSFGVFAGTPTAEVTPAVPTETALLDSVGATLEVGYDSRYYHRGLWIADNMTWTGLDVQVPLAEKLTLGLSAFYTTTVETPIPGNNRELDFSELDLGASLTYDLGFAKVGLVYTHYEYFNTLLGSDAGVPTGDGEGAVTGADEVGLTLSKSLGPVNLYGAFFYDFRIGGSYIELGADMAYRVTPWLSVVPAVKLGYGLDYYSNSLIPASATASAPSSGFTHVIPSISAPIQLTKSATFTPYLAYNVSMGARHGLNSQDSEFFAGIKLSIKF